MNRKNIVWLYFQMVYLVVCNLLNGLFYYRKEEKQKSLNRWEKAFVKAKDLAISALAAVIPDGVKINEGGKTNKK